MTAPFGLCGPHASVDGLLGIVGASYCFCLTWVGAQTAAQAPRTPPLLGCNGRGSAASERREARLARIGGSGRRPSLMDGPQPSWKPARKAMGRFAIRSAGYEAAVSAVRSLLKTA